MPLNRRPRKISDRVVEGMTGTARAALETVGALSADPVSTTASALSITETVHSRRQVQTPVSGPARRAKGSQFRGLAREQRRRDGQTPDRISNKDAGFGIAG